MTVALAILLSLLPRLPARASEVAASSQVVRGSAHIPPEHNPWSAVFGYDRRGRRVDVNYRIRWDHKSIVRDILSVPLHPVDFVRSSVGGILQGSRVDLYGVRLRPFRDAPIYPRESPTAVPASTATTTASSSAPRGRRWLNLTPSIEDLQASGEREARRWVIRQAFDRSLPGSAGAPLWQKEAAVGSLREAGEHWRSDWEDRRALLGLPAAGGPYGPEAALADAERR